MDYKKIQVEKNFGEKPLNVIADNRLVGRYWQWTEIIVFIQHHMAVYQKIVVVEYIRN